MDFWSFRAIFVDFSEARDLFGIIFQFQWPNYKFSDCGLILKKLRGLSAKCQKLEFPGTVFLKKNSWTKSTSPWTAPGRPVHSSTVDSTVADGRGSSELGLGAAPGHCGLPQGWRWEGRNAAQPGDRSQKLRRQRGGGASAVGLRLQAATARARLRRGGGEVKWWGAPLECGYPFIGSGGRWGQPGIAGGGGNWSLHSCRYWKWRGVGNYGQLKRGELLGATVVAPWRGRRRGRRPWLDGEEVEEAALGRRGEEEEEVGWAAWAERPDGPTGRWADWAESEGKILFRIKIWFLNILRLWKFVGWDLAGILMWRFFLNSSRLLKYLEKWNMTCHVMQP
jgi:hypothetical protein